MPADQHDVRRVPVTDCGVGEGVERVRFSNPPGTSDAPRRNESRRIIISRVVRDRRKVEVPLALVQRPRRGDETSVLFARTGTEL